MDLFSQSSRKGETSAMAIYSKKFNYDFSDLNEFLDVGALKSLSYK